MAVRLTPGELRKPNSKTREPRIDILKRAVLEGTPLSLSNKTDAVIANTSENLEAIARFPKEKKAFTLKTTKGRKISSSDIVKSALFGGGKGAGGGTKQTAIAEAFHCVWAGSQLIHGADKPIEYFTTPVLKQGMNKYTEIKSRNLDKMIELDGDWHTTCHLIGQKLIGEGILTKDYKLHHDSKDVNYIYNVARKKAFKEEGISGVGADKWNPADIWLMHKRLDVKKELNYSSLNALNNDILRLYNEGMLIGVSLKKLKKNSTPKLQEYNVGGKHTDVKFDDFIPYAAKKKDFFSTKLGYINTSSYPMEIISNGYMKTSKVEIKMGAARGGGAGWGALSLFAKNHLKERILSPDDIKVLALKIKEGHGPSVKRFYDMSNPTDNTLTYDYFAQMCSTKDPGWLAAKIAVVTIGHALYRSSQKDKDEFVNSVFLYAASASSISSAFIKVY